MEIAEQDLIINPSSERAILAWCMNDNDNLNEVENQGITHKYFGVKSHMYIYNALQYLYSKNIKATPEGIGATITMESAKKAIEEMGDDYIHLLADTYVEPESIPIFMLKLKQAYTRRQILEVCNHTTDFMKSERAEVLNPTELITSIESKINDLSIESTTESDFYKMGDDTDAVLSDRESHPSQVPGLEVGWPQVDRITNGFMPGDLTIVCAESKTGKSVTLMNWAIKLSIIDKIPILYIDTEMTARECEDRILSNLSGIPHNEVVSGMYVLDTDNGKAKDKIERIQKAKTLIQEGHYYHMYMPQFTIESISAIVKKFRRKFGIEAVFFDYIKIPSSDSGSMKNAQEYQLLGYLTSGLKDLGGILGIPVFSACQTNRANLGGGKKDATDIGGSYRILQLASKLMFLVNKSDEDIGKQGVANGNQQLQIAFQRNGESNCKPINIIFDKNKLIQREA